MKKIVNIITMIFLTMMASTITLGANPSYNMTPNSPLTSRVNVYNQSGYTYTVNATYMGQYGATRKFVMTLYPYPYEGSAILFPIVLPEYAVYLQIVRNLDNYLVYSGYVSSDDIYIQNPMKDKTLHVDIKHH